MEFSNFYTVETLQYLNDSHDYGYGVTDSDVEKVNRLITLMERERDRHQVPTAGDIIRYTTRSGEYYGKAHIERIRDGRVEICLDPSVPFCYETGNSVCYDTSGGPWSNRKGITFKPGGIDTGEFKTWGHAGRCANGAVYFKTSVRVWEYTEPDPLFGEYTTRDWAEYFISRRPDPERPGEFTYKGDGFAVYSETEFNRLVQILHGELFDGIYHGSVILWGYRMNMECLTEMEWNRTRADVHLSFLGSSPVKIRTCDDTHTVTIYQKQ